MAHRIDTSTAQKDKWGAGKNGWTDGDPQTGVKATSFNASFCDSVQEEICNVVEKSGLTLDVNDNTQLWKVLNTLLGKYLAIANNLSEIATAGAIAQSESRGNIGLGDIATKNAADFLSSEGGIVTGDITASGAITAGTVNDSSGRVYSPGNPPPAQDLSAYITTETANATFVTDIQLGVQTNGSSWNATNKNWVAPVGCTMVGINGRDNDESGDADVHYIIYKPVQKCINGVWVTIAG